MDTKRIKRISAAQESRTAKELGAGRTRPGSGAMDHAKGDVITGRAGTGFNSDDYLIENKFTFDGFYALNMDIWNKIAGEALRENMRIPMMQIDINKGTPAEVRLIVLDKNDFLGMQLERHFINLHASVSTEKKSYRLKGLDFFSNLSKIGQYREQIVFKKHKKILVVLGLEDFKQSIAKY